MPLVKVVEEYDPGVMDGTDAWELNLAAGWQPDRMEIARTCGNGAVDAGSVRPLDALQEKPSWYLVPDSAWSTPLSQLGLFQEAARKANPAAYPMAGIVPLYKGDWRHMNGLEIQSTGPRDVRVRFPMSRRYASWLREVTSETSPFSIIEHEPGLPPPTRAAIGAWCSPGPPWSARLKATVPVVRSIRRGCCTAWSDWIATRISSSPGPTRAFSYPTVYLPAAEVAKYKQALPASALPADFQKKLLVGASPWAQGRGGPDAGQVGPRLARLHLPTVLASPTTGHHWTAPQYLTAARSTTCWVGLSCRRMFPAEIRARVALICYLWEDADIVSYANGSHSGCPNMGTARFAPMVSFLPLVPDHPLAEKWRAHMAQYLEYKTLTQTAPGGGYFEFGTAYHMHGYARVMNVLPALAAAGAVPSAHLWNVDRQNWSYYLNLLTPPDSRWKYRVIPGLANSPPGYTEHLLEAAGELARDPKLAANLVCGPGWPTAPTTATIPTG